MAGTTARQRPSRSTFGLIGCALSAYHCKRLSRLIVTDGENFTKYYGVAEIKKAIAK